MIPEQRRSGPSGCAPSPPDRRPPLPEERRAARPRVPGAGGTRASRRPSSRHALGRRAAARRHRARPCPVTGGDPRRRADGEPGPAAHDRHHGHSQGHQRGARTHARREPAPARDRARLRHAHRRVPPGTGQMRRPALGLDTHRDRRDLRRRGGGMTRAAVFVGAVVLAWLIWDTDADPVRLAHGLPWIFDFVRRMIPPDLRVLPAALAGAVKTVEIAVLGTAVAAVLALPLGFLSARNVAAGAVFYPARAVLNFFRSVDTLVYALVFVAAVRVGPFPGVLPVVGYTTTLLAKLRFQALERDEPGPVDGVTRY